ncbi:MAG: nucleoside deaminase [Rickettsiales bacterium]|jgi:tRNA(Arg) A34 adenosine deaminase TadA|nr:nucleoside deaminase [Rickettsiales bacterium]
MTSNNGDIKGFPAPVAGGGMSGNAGQGGGNIPKIGGDIAVFDAEFMKIAIDLAKIAEKHADVPIGAVIVADGKVIGQGENRVELDGDPTAHAEIVAIHNATKHMGYKFLPQNSTIYVSLEPCAMCAAAISFARIGRVVFAAADEKGGAILHNSRVFDTDGHLWKPEVGQMPELAHESSELLRNFFKNLRK